MVHSVAAHESLVWAAHADKITCVDWTAKTALTEASHALTNIGLTPCKQYIVGLSAGEEKTVLVLDAKSLEVRATHAFPKRPSAWAIGGEQLLVADKFGDVFSVGLLNEGSVFDDNNKLKIAPILGHVSMVLAMAAFPDRVLTADRDEHIRVSQLPKAYVIEQFLLGHTEYVAHLAVHETQLLSGGGDRFVVAWDWTTGTELARLDIATVLNLSGDAKVDVCALAVNADTAWIAIEGVSKIIKASFPKLETVELLDLEAPALSLAVTSQKQCFAALPDGIVEVGDGETPTKLEIGEKSDMTRYTQTHLRKTATH